MIQKGENVSPLCNERRNTYVTDNLTSALLALLSDKKITEISVSELIEKAGVCRASFYRNFKSKEDILIKYADKITIDFTEKSGIKYGTESFREYTVMLFEHLERNRDFCVILLNNGLLHIVGEIFDKYFSRNAASLNEQYRQMFVSGGFFNIFKFWLIGGCKESPKELSDMFFDFM